MTDKASDAFRTISEVSTELDVPPHVLRFWETKFTSLRPLKRSGGRRYYRRDDVAMITKIRDLLYKEGFTIKGAQRFLKSREAGSPSDINPAAADHGSTPGLLAVQALLQTARKRLSDVKQQLGS
jgi:DNA-binding transcriptional MerR regulator